MNTIRKDWFARWATYTPENLAVRDTDKQISFDYFTLNQRANQAAQYLKELGVTKGDRVAVLSEYCLDYIALAGAAMKSGIIIVPLNYRLQTKELSYIINHSDPSLVLVDDVFKQLIDTSLIASPQCECLSLNSFAMQLDTKENENCEFIPVDIKDDDPLFIIYTSGTTGFPKGAVYSHKMAFWNAVNTQLRLNLSAQDHTIICMPPFHTGGWNVLLLPLLLQGASFSILRKFDAEKILRLFDQEHATLFMGVPTMLKMLAESKSFNSAKLNSLKYLLAGGEAMPLPLIETWEQRGISIRQGYGLTEVGPNVTSLHEKDAVRKIGSIGIENFFIETRLVDSSGNDVGTGEDGELWLKGPVVTPGYWNDPSATQSAFEDDWFKTGDIMMRDLDGYLYVRDRIKNLFISGGENVYPVEVEHFLRTHPAIEDVAVCGIKDEKWGEVGKALIVTEDKALSEEVIKDFCQGSLAKYKIPKHIEFVQDIPKTENGKIDRKRIKQLVQ